MDKRVSVLIKSTKPYKLYALILLFVLSCILLAIQISSHQFKSHYTKQVLSLPQISSEDTESEQDPEEFAWKIIETRSGDTFGTIFKRLGLSQQTLQTIIHDNPHAKSLANIKPNQKIRFLIQDQILEKIIMPLNPREFLLVYRDKNQYHTKIKSRTMEVHNEYATATVQGSLYTTAKRANISYRLIQQMITIFNWEINFAKDIRSGDQFSIIYKAFYIDDTMVNTGEILAVTYNNHGNIHRAIRHTSSNGNTDYYTPEGASMKKAFSRYPIKFSHISSTFSLSRRHPILHYNRAHKGIDLAAPIGTPIHATGDGHIAIIGRDNGYGNMIKVLHNKTYASIYGHMLKFQKGLAKGDFVKRGQVIGYVGQSGLATGPHCHYEFHVNQRPNNPTTITLPNAQPVSGHELATFKNQANSLIASLKLYEAGNLATANSSKKSADTG